MKVHICIYTYMYIYIYIHIDRKIYTYTYKHIYTYTYTHVNISIHLNIYRHIYPQRVLLAVIAQKMQPLHPLNMPHQPRRRTINTKINLQMRVNNTRGGVQQQPRGVGVPLRVGNYSQRLKSLQNVECVALDVREARVKTHHCNIFGL